MPRFALNQDSFVALVAVLGTTISPYLFCWQAWQEAEEVKTNRGEKALKHAPAQADVHLQRIHIDTLVGRAFSHAQAASTLTPIAGRFSGVLFVCAIVGRGLRAWVEGAPGRR